MMILVCTKGKYDLISGIGQVFVYDIYCLFAINFFFIQNGRSILNTTIIGGWI